MTLLAALLAALLGTPAQQAQSLVPKLVERIQGDLAEVDRRLDEAADADKLSDTLTRTHDAHVRTIADLEELIHQLKYHRGQGS
ncbi:MAG TPA: hypothetical protein VFY71_11200 [Planctomycetota bacterium]|nr:hypothetical protein [Planctomycetota bacterium]